MNIFDFKTMKQNQQKISMITCYDYWSAKIIAASEIDCVLVGDSLAMVMHGHETTIPATLDLMTLHTRAVVKGVGNKFVITDLPFLAHRKGLSAAMNAVEQIIQAGAQAIKIEGAEGNLELISHMVQSGIPVMGHLGLRAQSIHQLGGFRVQARENKLAELLMHQATELEQAGCFALVLECIPADLASVITARISIPTIGIGAGQNVDGQVLVFHDLLGFNPDFKPKFLKEYFSGYSSLQTALSNFNKEVKTKIFPTTEHSY